MTKRDSTLVGLLAVLVMIASGIIACATDSAPDPASGTEADQIAAT